MRTLLTPAAVLLLSLGTAAAASADEVSCRAAGGALTGRIDADVVVDTNCLIENAVVDGNVEYEGPFHARIEDSTIAGDVECEDEGSVAIVASRIYGDVEDCDEPFDDGRGKKGKKPKRLSFRAPLSGFQEVPAVSTSGHGLFFARLDRDDAVLRYSLSYDDLEGGAVKFAHIHLGRTGTNGGVIAFLCSNDPPPAGVDTPACPAEGQRLEGKLDEFDVVGPAAQGLDPGEAGEALRALLAGAAYVNVHTDAFPAGEIRGQIEAKPGKRKGHEKKKRRDRDD